MVASQGTIEAVMRVVLKHVDRATAIRIFRDLTEVPGNKSFRETIVQLQRLIGEKRR